jgi:hypothetical protein
MNGVILVPVCQFLMEIISSSEFSGGIHSSSSSSSSMNSSTSSSLYSSDSIVPLRVQKNVISSSSFLTSVFSQTISLFYSHLAILSFSIGFPEYVQPILYSLRKISKVLIPATKSENEKGKIGKKKISFNPTISEFKKQVFVFVIYFLFFLIIFFLF